MEHILKLTGLAKSYGSQLILTQVELELQPGEVVGLIGENGSGKTTLMKMILGFTKPDQGQINFRCTKENKIGYLLNCQFFEYLSGYDNLKVLQQYFSQPLPANQQDQKIRQLLAFVGLSVNNKRVKSYSFGMKQRLGLALALMNAPDFLVLDEPFVGLDPVGVEQFVTYIQQLSQEAGKTILISSHQLAEIERVCDRFVLIEKQTLVEIPPSEKEQVIIVIRRPDKLLDLKLANSIQVSPDGCIFSFENRKDLLNETLQEIYQHQLEVLDVRLETPGLSAFFEKKR
ncbi:ABC transporter ATP-binding protein [Enterococcus sp. AZ109]|uniref:ABC transporter ATP-binding protein n=1 Tax=Enterococcus sp. AZ109 TaxID=2774634 RepID=UPI003F29BB48